MNEEQQNEGRYTFEAELWPPKIKVTGDNKEWVERMSQINLLAVTEGAKDLIESLPEDERANLLKLDEANQVKPVSNESYNQLPLFKDIDTPTHQDEIVSMPIPQNDSYELKTDSVSSSAITMREFYHNLTPKFNNDYTVAIIAWFTKYGDNSEISSADFEIGYKAWQYFGVDMPDSKLLADRIKNACNKGYVYRTEFGTYTISRQGEERVNEMKTN